MSVDDVVTMFTHSIATTQALTLVRVVSDACHNSRLPTHSASVVLSTTQERGNPVQFVSVQLVGVHNIGVVSVGLVSVLFVRVSVPAKVAKSASVTAVLNCAIVPLTVLLPSAIVLPVSVCVSVVQTIAPATQ